LFIRNVAGVAGAPGNPVFGIQDALACGAEFGPAHRPGARCVATGSDRPSRSERLAGHRQVN
jgi:hypothetical protein